MRRLQLALVLASLLLPGLTGCGSGSAAPFSVSCKSYRLPTGFIRAYVKVTNTTSNPGTAYIYGPAVAWVRHIYPVLDPTEVVVQVARAQRTFIGFVVPRILAGRAAQLILRFEPPTRANDLLVSDRRTIQANDWSVLNNPHCVIRKLRS